MPNMQSPILPSSASVSAHWALYIMPIVQILIFASYSTCFDIFGIVDNAIYVMVVFLVIGGSKGWSDGMLTGCHPERTECI